MKYYQIDYKRLVRLLLPTMLRKQTLSALLDALVTPITTLYYRFLSFRDACIYRLTITPQICYLQKLLNDRYDNTQRRIYISDGIYYETMYIYTENESLDLYAFTETEKQDIPLYTSSETGSESVDFIVNVPNSLRFDEKELRALLNNYKLASKTYKINKI